MKFYTNLHKIIDGFDPETDTNTFIDVGTIFKIDYMDGYNVKLMRIDGKKSDNILMIDPKMMKFGFKESDSI